jgi:hypothetical protein
MYTKVVYAAGIALLTIGIIFYFIDSGFLTYEKSLSSSYNNDSAMTTTTSSSIVNDSTTTTTTTGDDASAIDKTFVKPASYQLFKSLSHLNIEDFSKQIVVYHPKLKQPLSQPSLIFSPMQIVLAQSNDKKTPSNYENLTVSVKSINVVSENNVQSLQIALNVHNPNKGSAILETLNYNVYLNNVRLASADIGTKPEGFIDSLSSVYPIIGNQTITLKDAQPLTSEGSSLFNSNGVLINDSKSNSSKPQNLSSNFYIVNGTFSTTLTRGTQSQSSETPFNLQFPIK